MSQFLDKMMHTNSLGHQVASHTRENFLYGTSAVGVATFLRNLADDIQNGYYDVKAISQGEYVAQSDIAGVTLNLQLIPQQKPHSEPPIGNKVDGPFGRHR